MRQTWMAAAVAAGAAAALTNGAAQAQERRFEKPYWTERPVIEAVGRARIETTTNRARFAVGFTETDKTAAEAAARAAERARLAAQAVRAVTGRNARVQTNLTTRPIYETYRDREGNILSYDTPDRIERYVAEAGLSVTLLDTSKAAQARAAALAAKPDTSTDLGYSLELTAEIQREAFAAAVKDGAERAKAAAAAAGASLGPLLVLQEGEGPCLGQWYAMQPGLEGNVGFAIAPAAMAEADGAVLAAGEVRGRSIKITQGDIDRLNLPSDPEPAQIEGRACLVYGVGGR